MNKLVLDFFYGGILTVICTFMVYHYNNLKATKMIGFLYGGPILFAYIIFKIFKENGMHHAQSFVKFSIYGIIASLGMILPWTFLNSRNIYTLFVCSLFYILVIYVLLLPQMIST